MSIAEREYILRPIHEEAEKKFKEHGWQDDSHGVWVHAYTAETLVTELIRERQRCARLEDRIARLEAALDRVTKVGRAYIGTL